MKLFAKLVPPRNWVPLFNLQIFRDSEKTTPESCRVYSNLMNDDEFGSAKLLKFKYRRGDQIIHSFWKIGSLFFNLQKFQEPDKKNPLNHTEHMEI